MESSREPTRPDRKTVEKNRRIHMKFLCSKLESLIPTSPSTKEGTTLPVPDKLDKVVCYIKGLQERIEKMQKMKRQLMGGEGSSGIRLPHLEVKVVGQGLRVVLLSSLGDRHLFYEVVRVLEEEGAVVVNANLSAVGDKAFHTIHSMAADSTSKLEAGKILERLKVIHEVY